MEVSMNNRYGRAVCFCGVIGVGLGASAAAHATTIFLEAESARQGANGSRITSPLLIKDDDQASHGSYIEVLPGNNSKDTMPATEGVASLKFDNPGASATFTIWARVIASFDGDDSFWLKMDNGSAIKWNGFQLGTAWHWVHVTADGASSPAQFTLGTGTHTLKIAYREDGTKLDQLIITSDSSFNPTSTAAAPATPQFMADFDSTSVAGTILSWQEVPGAQSYTLTDENGTVIATGLTSHSMTQTTGCFKVIAVNGAGSSAPSQTECADNSGFIQRKEAGDTMSVVSPMKIASFALATQAGTAESLSVVPAHGRGRYDFRIAGPTQIQVWAEVGAPDLDNDSFWVRVDQGAWIKWNNIPNFSCVPVSDSDNGGARVTFNVSNGSHFIEFAYREIGTTLGRFAPTEPNPGFAPCED
jgi:hypothetical protein